MGLVCSVMAPEIVGGTLILKLGLGYSFEVPAIVGGTVTLNLGLFCSFEVPASVGGALIFNFCWSFWASPNVGCSLIFSLDY